MFFNIQIDLLILKTYCGQFTLTTTKSLHIIFNTLLEQVGAAGGMTVRSESKDPKITTTTLITYIQLH